MKGASDVKRQNTDCEEGWCMEAKFGLAGFVVAAFIALAIMLSH